MCGQLRALSLKQLVLALFALVLLSSAAFAAYPEHPVYLVVGFTPGTGGDTLARLVAKKLAAKWGQPVIVENRTGASNTIAEGVVAHAAPDGYTLLMVNATYTVTPSQFKLSYDPIKSFTPLSRLTIQPDVLLASPSLPAKTVPELVALAKGAPGKLYFGTSGIGGAPYLAMRLLLNDTGTKMININYPGSAEALLALQRGEVQLVFASVHDSLPIVENHKARALAVSSAHRIGSLAGVPTVAQAAGLKDYDIEGWQGVLAPAGTPRAIVAKIHDDLVEVMNAPEIKAKLKKSGDSILVDTPEEFASFIKHDIPKWANLLGTTSAAN